MAMGMPRPVKHQSALLGQGAQKGKDGKGLRTDPSAGAAEVRL